MAITIAQTVAYTETASSTTHTLTLSTTLGNRLVVVASIGTGVTATIADSGSHTWSTVASNTTNQPIYIFATTNANPTALTSGTITVTTSSSASCTFRVYELTGADNTAAADVTSTGTAASGTAADSGTTATPSGTVDMAIGGASWFQTNLTADTSPDIRPTTGATTHFDVSNLGGNGQKLSSASLALTGATAQKFSTTLGGSLVGWSAAVALFKALPQITTANAGLATSTGAARVPAPSEAPSPPTIASVGAANSVGLLSAAGVAVADGHAYGQHSNTWATGTASPVSSIQGTLTTLATVSGSAVGPNAGAAPVSGVSVATGLARTPTITIVNSAMTRARTAFANAGTTPAYWLAIGDSVTEQAGATTWDNGYVSKALQSIQATYLGASKGYGYINTHSTNFDALGTDQWTKSGGGTNVVSGNNQTFGTRTYTWATNETGTLHFTGTQFLIHYKLGGQPFTVAVDGGAPTTVTPAAGTAYTGTFTSGTLSAGAHSVLCTPTSGQVLPVVGGMGLDNIRMFDHGLTGQTTSGAPGFNSATLVDQLVVCPNPALVSICLMINDYGFSVDPATSQSNLQTIIANVKAACSTNPSFLLIIPYQANWTGITTPSFAWSQYVTAANNVQAADPANVQILDLGASMAQPTAGNSYDGGKFNSSDLLHPNDTGHSFIAGLVATAITG